MVAIEETLAHFVCNLQLSQVPAAAQQTVRRMLLAVVGTGLAGGAEDGISELRELLLEAGGTPQATTLVFGDKLPAAAAAQFNATLCRALDFCDAMAPGPHLGAAIVPAALATAEMLAIQTGCVVSGAQFLTALVAGAEVASRFNLTENQYNGLDPTGVCVVFGAAAAASFILGLNALQTRNALALAFNRCGGSFQSHVDGSLGVRVVQGWVAQAGVQCSQMAQRGMTGPQNFLTGHYGYAHLYGRGTLNPETVVADLDTHWKLQNMVFKKVPSCGVTQGVTELVLRLLADHAITAEQVQSAQVRLPPYAHRLVGHAFHIGNNPRVDAQFSAAYCVANALVRRSARLAHFTPQAVHDAAVGALARRVVVVSDATLDVRGHTAVDLALHLKSGKILRCGLDIAPGFPGAELTALQHTQRFNECLAYAAENSPKPPIATRRRVLLEAIENIEHCSDVQSFVALLH